MTLPLTAGGEELGTMWGREKVLEMLPSARFAKVEAHDLEHDIRNCLYVSRKQVIASS